MKLAQDYYSVMNTYHVGPFSSDGLTSVIKVWYCWTVAIALGGWVGVGSWVYS